MRPSVPNVRGALALLLTLALVGIVGPHAAAADPAPGADAKALERARSIERDLVAALRRVEPASVTVVGRDRIPGAGGAHEAAPLVLQGAGSGVLIEWNGTWVLTNAHVVDQHAALEVITSDGRSHAIVVQALDKGADLAVARFEHLPAGLRPTRVRTGAARALEPGTWVSAAGNPFMLALDGRSAATLGVVSTIRPPKQGGYVDVPTVQHDAEVNPGNSGGPLWSLDGELLGLNGSIATRSVTTGAGPSYTGASFAVPVDAIHAFLTKTLGPDKAPPAASSPPSSALREIQAEYRRAIDRVVPSTVVCVPHGVRGQGAGLSSGVVVHPDGLILSDGDAGLAWRGERVDGQMQAVRTWQEDVDVRLWDPDTLTWRTWRGRVVHRDRSVDMSLIQLQEMPVGGLKQFVPPGRSATLEIGDVTLAVGSAYDDQTQAPPSLTAGVLSARDEGSDGFLYTSASVNRGVNGGAMVDLGGRLVGTISTHVDAAPDTPYGFLGKAVPIDRILAALRGVPAAQPLLALRPEARVTSTGGMALDSVVHAAGRAIRPSLVSLEIERTHAVSSASQLEGRPVEVARYQGPMSGILVGRGGLIVTSLHNLTNVAERLDVLWDAPAGAGLDEGLSDIRRIRVHRADGETAEAEVVGHDIRWGFALLKVSAPWGAFGAPVVADAVALERGRMVVGAGDPFGARRPLSPLLTAGILSKEHATTAPAPWRGMWQTDAGVIDGNVGGAAVDLDGHLLGMLTLWDPSRHGRNSGIGFIVPWNAIQTSIRRLEQGQAPQRGLLGVYFRRGFAPVIERVVEDSAAARAGLVAGDAIREIDGQSVPTILDAMQTIGQRMSGERVRVTVTRGEAREIHTIVLGERGR